MKPVILSILLFAAACAPKPSETFIPQKPLASIWVSSKGEKLDLSNLAFEGTVSREVNGCFQLITAHANILHFYNSDCAAENYDKRYSVNGMTLTVCELVTEKCEVYL